MYLLKLHISALASLSPFECIDDVVAGSNGSTSLTMENKMENDHLYLVFVRRISGDDAYPPYAYLLIMRSKNWRYTLIGEESGLENKSISGGKLTLTFTGTQWTRMTTYKVM